MKLASTSPCNWPCVIQRLRWKSQNSEEALTIAEQKKCGIHSRKSCPWIKRMSGKETEIKCERRKNRGKTWNGLVKCRRIWELMLGDKVRGRGAKWAIVLQSAHWGVPFVRSRLPIIHKPTLQDYRLHLSHNFHLTHTTPLPSSGDLVH